MAIKFTDGLLGIEQVQFTMLVCNDCKCPFMVTTQHNNLLKSSHKTFYCPNGHTLNYPSKTPCEKKAEEAEKKLADQERWNEQIREQRNKAWNEVEELQKQNRKLRSEECPHCQKLYIDLKKHIKQKHPNG